MFRVYLYRLLRLCLAKCPSDSSIALVGGLWLEFVAPWTFVKLSEGGDDAPLAVWEHYVVNNYFFYHTLLSSFLDHAQGMLEGFGEALARSDRENLDAETTTSTLMPLLLLLARVLATISPFADLLRQIEEEELLHADTQGWHRTASFIRRVQSQRGVREQLRALESERFVLHPLFDSAARTRTLEILYWLERIYGSLPEMPSSTSADNVQVGSVHLMERQGGGGGGSVSQHPPPIHTTIMQCEEELCALFGIQEEDFTDFSQSFTLSREHTRLVDGGGALRKRKIVPASLPDRRLQSKLAQHGDAATPIVKSYESVLLVQLTGALSDLLNRLVGVPRRSRGI